MSHESIESWRATHAPQHQRTLPNLLSKLKIIPRPEPKVADDSALDTWSESSIDGLPPASHTLPSEPYLTRDRSLSKSNPLAPGRRASVISMSPDQSNISGGLSRLTIVRAPSGSKENRRPSGSSPAISMPHSPKKSFHPNQAPPPGSSSPRLSFASSSFGSPIGSHIASGFQSGSYMSLADDSVRPSHSRQNSLAGRENALELTPREVVDMARSTSSGHARSFSSSSLSSRPNSSTRPWDRHQAEEEEFEPVEFVPLKDEVLLPFEIRGAEIKDLMEEDKNKALFHLLKLAFSPVASLNTNTGAKDQHLESDPKTWSFHTFVTYLTEIERQTMPDRAWVNKIRQAVEYRSEPLWENLKGLLGVDEGDFDDDVNVEITGSHPIDNARLDRAERDVWIQGLEYADDSDDQLDQLDRSPHSRSRRRSSKFDSLEDSIVGGASFSPDRDTISLPSTASYESSVSSHIMEPIGEDEEESSPPVDSPLSEVPEGKALAGKSHGSSTQKQSSLNVSEGFKTPMGGTPEREFTLDRSDTIKPDQNVPSTGGQSEGQEILPAADTKRERTRSYVGVSIVSSPIPTGLSGGEEGGGGGSSSTTIPSSLSGHRRGRSSFSSSSFSSSPLAREFARPTTGTSADATPVGSWRGSLPRGMGLVQSGWASQSTEDDPNISPTRASGNEFDEADEKWDPRSERGPGNPLFPTSFASLSLKPFERPPTSSFGKSGTGLSTQSQYSYTQMNIPPGGQAGNPGGIIMKDWAREMVEHKEFHPMSGSALTIASSEQSV